MKTLKTPNSKECEYVILSSMISSCNAFNMGVERLTRKDFYYPEHQVVFEAMTQCYDQHQAVDTFLISEKLKDDPLIKKVGGAEYIHQLGQIAGSSFQTPAYIEELRGLTIKRELQQRARQILDITGDEKLDAASMVDQASQWITNLAGDEEDSVKTVDAVLQGDGETYLDMFEREQEEAMRRQEQGIPFKGIPLGFHRLDDMIGGLNAPDFIIVGARPGVGKSTFGLNLAVNVAKLGEPVLFFTMEMTAVQLTERMLSMESAVSHKRVKNRTVNGQEFQLIVEATQRIEKLPITIDETQYLTVNHIAARCRREKAIGGVSAVVVDYLGLIKDAGQFQTKALAVAEITRRLKTLAKEIDAPIVCLSQLNRESVKDAGGSREPKLSDLRDSGAIEQDADSVIFLHRPLMGTGTETGQMKFVIAKNRHGETGSIDGWHKLEYCQMGGYERSIREHMAYDAMEQIKNHPEMDHFNP